MGVDNRGVNIHGSLCTPIKSTSKLKVKKPKIETLLDAYRTTKYPLIHGNNCCIILYNNEIKESNTNILLYLLAG